MKQKAIVTIDTEGHDGKDPIAKLIFGETAEGKFGIERIMDELDAFDVKGLFFVDFAEAWDYGEEKVKNVVDTIRKRGHNVGVHIHPDHMADKNRLFLWEYSREEQCDIITKCTELYNKLVGKKPLSFRAGKYSANHETLNILSELGYKYDFSAFYHQQWCGIKPAFTINTPCQYKTLIEFPVTMHTTFRVGSIKREDKIDIEGMTTGELQYALQQVIIQDFPVVVTLFFHSFSLLKWREKPDMPIENTRNIEKLKRAISYVRENTNIDLIAENDLKDITPVNSDTAVNSQIIWKAKLRGIVYTFGRAAKIAKYNKKARLLLGGLLVVCVVLLIVIAVVVIPFS